jgi:hypothetical protein
VRNSLSGIYGRCGGMAFMPLDYFRKRVPLPRGTSRQPQRDNPHDAKLREAIYKRLIDSLVLNAGTTLAWMAVLKVPPNGAGIGLLWKMTNGEFNKIKPVLAAGTPVPIGIIGNADNPTDNHQALAIGYDEQPDGSACLFVYDNNRPNKEAVLRWNTRDPSVPFSYTCGASDNCGFPVFRGFFCEAYTPMDPILTASWQLRPGNAHDVAVGDDRCVWVIGSAPLPGGFGIHRWNGSDWDTVDGSAVRIAVNGNEPWVVTNANTIFRRVDNRWVQVPGLARDIGAGGGQVWIIGTNPIGDNHDIHRWNGSGWTLVDGAAERIDVDGCGRPWVSCAGGEIYCRINDAWQRISGAARDVGCGGSGWVIGTNAVAGGHGIHWYDRGDWLSIPGGAVAISAGASNEPWVVNDSGQIFEWTY